MTINICIFNPVTKALEKKETVAAYKMFSAEGPPDGITPGAMFTELRKLQEEVYALWSLVNPSRTNLTDSNE